MRSATERLALCCGTLPRSPTCCARCTSQAARRSRRSPCVRENYEKRRNRAGETQPGLVKIGSDVTRQSSPRPRAPGPDVPGPATPHWSLQLYYEVLPMSKRISAEYHYTHHLQRLHNALATPQHVRQTYRAEQCMAACCAASPSVSGRHSNVTQSGHGCSAVSIAHTADGALIM